VSQDRIRKAYENGVELNYQLYNGLFLTLPLDAVEQTGLLLPLLEEDCHKGLADGLDPQQIIESFFDSQRPDLDELGRVQFLFKVIQYVERQIVLVDALEDASYSAIHDVDAANQLRKLTERVSVDGLRSKLAALLEEFSARVILTAHPTQFYPGPVLAIITDLTDAIRNKDTEAARTLLQQLGNTPFFNKEKPTPLDEAANLSWYLGNIFYPAISTISDSLSDFFDNNVALNPTLLSVGFWPGGDRDGNPLVSSATTLRVAAKLRARIIECYHRDIRRLKRRLSFAGVYEELEAVERKLNGEIINETDAAFEDVSELLSVLETVEKRVAESYQGLFLDQLISFKRRVQAFGFYFASLDIRQDSRVLSGVLDAIQQARPELFPEDFASLDEQSRSAALFALKGDLTPDDFSDELVKDTLGSMQAMRAIQASNGERGCHRYIISNCRGAADVANLVGLFRLSGWHDAPLSVELVPLFETISDLAGGGASMRKLYSMPAYASHLKARGGHQTVMLGFSDGTKDGGYLMANWAIYRAKEDITAESRASKIEVSFFDGRGGPPGRGGGNTYEFYAALGKQIESNQIQITVQGQTISSFYGTMDAALHNLRQLLAAGLENNLYDRPARELNDEQRALIEQMGELSYAKYQAFKAHPLFLPYLEQMSTLHYYSMSNIASRPSKRGGSSELKFEDLRAIPFVGAWGQLHQNVPGFYGLGSALKALEDEGRLAECQALYQDSLFFRALLNNSMQSMSKANFDLTRYMAKHETFGEFWQQIHDEYVLSRDMALKVSGQTVLLEDSPRSRLSINLRQRVVLPLLIIQQYAMMKLNELADDDAADDASIARYEKMVIRSMFGNINASRNSA